MNFRPDSAILWLRPHWLRPTALASGAAINIVVALLVSYAHLRKPPPLPAIEVTILPKQIAPKETTPKPPATPQPQPKPQPPPPPPPPPPEAAKPPPPPPPPKPAKPPPPPPQATKPPPPPPPKQAAPKPPEVAPPKPTEKALRQKREEQRRIEQAREKRQKEKEARRKAAREKAERERAERRRARERARAASGPSRAAYASIVVREIQRLKYLGARRARGATGRVSVTFTVGRSGRIVSHRVHSANPRLAGAVAAMMAAFHAPPPPGGRFSASTNINFAR